MYAYVCVKYVKYKTRADALHAQQISMAAMETRRDEDLQEYALKDYINLRKKRQICR